MDALVEEEVGLQSRFPKTYTLSKILAWEAHANIVPFVNSNKIYKDQGFSKHLLIYHVLELR